MEAKLVKPGHSSTLKRLKALLRNHSEFLANFEIAEEKMRSWQEEIDKRHQQQATLVQNQLDKLQEDVGQLQELLTEAGAARWRVTAEKLLLEGQAHLEEIKTTSEQHLKAFNEHNQSLQKQQDRTISQIQELISRIDLDSLYAQQEHNRSLIEQSMMQSKRLFNQFKLKTAVIMAVVGITSSIITGFYLNDEAPWDIHKIAKHERQVGQTLIKAWPKLDNTAKLAILAHKKKTL